METKHDTICWWIKYLKYCKQHDIDIKHYKQTYQEYVKTMEKVKEWVEKNDLLS